MGLGDCIIVQALVRWKHAAALHANPWSILEWGPVQQFLWKLKQGRSVIRLILHELEHLYPGLGGMMN